MKNLVANIRKEKGFTQQDLADVCGCTRRTIAAIEANETECSIALADRICCALGCHMYELFIMDSSIYHNVYVKSERIDAVNTVMDRIYSYAGAFREES